MDQLTQGHIVFQSPFRCSTLQLKVSNELLSGNEPFGLQNSQIKKQIRNITSEIQYILTLKSARQAE